MISLDDLLDKTCVIGLSYYGLEGELLKQAQYAGSVSGVDAQRGITVRLCHASDNVGEAEFVVPPNLTAWFVAPPGRYRHTATGVDITNPDYLVTWSVYRTQGNAVEGQHEWWEWVPNTVAPSVGQAH
jgi:hypothetical protein